MKLYLHKTPWLVKKIYPDLTWDIKTKEKKIYLTFDDGPIPDVTDWVIKTLADFNAKATFFCVGENVSKHPAVYQRVIANGHLTGNHTFNHLNGRKTADPMYFENIQKCESAMMSHGGGNANFFRPPYGRIKKSQIKALKPNYNIIMWDVLSGDFDNHLTSEGCLKSTINATGKGSIVLFHDSVKTVKMLEFVLPRYLEHFKEKGFTFDLIELNKSSS